MDIYSYVYIIDYQYQQVENIQQHEDERGGGFSWFLVFFFLILLVYIIDYNIKNIFNIVLVYIRYSWKFYY